MNKINEEWHKRNIMPKNPTLQQRIDWHLEHSKECGCRPIPASVAMAIKKTRKI